MIDQPDTRYDPVLMRDGDSRNVVDKYKTWTEQAIVEDLDRTRAPLHVAVENWEKDLNLGTITRSANAFNVSGFHIVGEKKWNRRGAMATYRYVHVYHHESVEELYAFCQEHDLSLTGIDNCETSVPIEGTILPARTMLLFGNEGIGLTPQAKKLCEKIYEISMSGSTRSLNSSVAAGIAMYHWQAHHTKSDE
ncbi:MAG TPA: TrmH family RNA methyltransferase [Acidimicrobiia bacterium]|nr:TrmH family RNA methyltransferase [Acidimicrobiia bacterium]